MQITRLEFENMQYRYLMLVVNFPLHLQDVCPPFRQFLSPVNLTTFKFGYYDTEELSITGAKRWQMLLSPHAPTLLRAWALQQLDG